MKKGTSGDDAEGGHDGVGNESSHDRAVALVRERGPVSTAQLGRLLNVGYARACLIRAQLEAEGVLHDEAR